MARMSHFCRQWRLKPSASKTISSVFHLHNTSATRELSVYLDGQRLRRECHPTYLGVTLDRTLSYRVHLTKTAGKLKYRNNLMKLAGSTWGASANTLQSSALAFCYPAAKFCAPVKTCPTPANIENLRIIRAKTRHTIKSTKRESWQSFVSKINSRTSIKKVWTMVRKITGKPIQFGI